MKLKIHPYADLFPMMTAAELDALASDIDANGLRQPIVRYQGLILDGRNRLLACEKIGAEPRFTDFEGDDAGALALVESLNIERRDLTAAQRAIVAARRWMLSGDTKNRGGDRSDSKLQTVTCSSLAKKYKASNSSISQARDLLAEAPDLAEQVGLGLCHLAPAYEQLQERRQAVAQRERDAKRIAKYMDAVRDGEMAFEEALQKVMEEERQERERLASEADARRNWLKEFAEHLAWFERSLSDRTDERLSWYTQPNSPGLFDHGITAGRITVVIEALTRARAITFGEHHVGTASEPRQPKARGAQARP
jgi:hypothetical protein